MTRLLVALHLRVLEIKASHRRDDRGQGTLEYIGMIAVAVLLVVAVLTAARGINLGKFFTDQIRQIVPE